MIREVISIWITSTKRSYTLQDSKGGTVCVDSADKLLEYLTTDYGCNSTFVVWNLYELFGILQNLLPKDLADKLIKEDRVWYKDFKIFSSSGKVLSIGHNVHEHDNFYHKVENNIYSLKQYFPDKFPTNLDELVSKSNELMQVLHELCWQTDTLSSAIAIYNQAVLKKEFIPSIYDMEDTSEVDGMISYCYKMMCREWRTVYKVGHFKNATDIDLRSSYPSFIKDFGNTSECKIIHSDKLILSDFGVCAGKLTLTGDYHPIVNQQGSNVLGEYPDIITTEQWGYITHFCKGTFKMIDGYFLTFDHIDDKPFYDLMVSLYEMRTKGGLYKTLAKSISVGLYGYQSQEYPERYGDYFNPIYSVMTTSRCALKMGKLIENNNLQQDLVSVTVDGLLSTRDINLDTENIFGGWKKEMVDALVLSCGHQYITDHTDVGKKDAYQNNYDSMLAEINKSPNKSYLGGVLLNKNMMITHRNFKEYPKNGRQLLNNIFSSEAILI